MTALLPGGVGWSVLLAASILWEIGGRLFHYARIADMFAYLTRWRMARLTLFGMWIWVGWHFFIRGWRFFLRR